MSEGYTQTLANDWVAFPGGELEGKRPKALCPSCRARMKRLWGGPFTAGGPGRQARMRPTVLCFQCYRADLDRERALKAAGELCTASEERFQSALPFEPVNAPRLEQLKADRASARAAAMHGTGPFVERRRRAQIEARHTLQEIFGGIRARRLAAAVREQQIAAAIAAAELQLPDAWLPFVVAR